MKQEGFRFVCLGLMAVGFGGAIAKHALDNWVVRYYLDEQQFGLIQVFHAGGSVAIVGSALTLLLLAIVTRRRWETAVRQEAIELLIQHSGRDDMPLEYRAAIQYVVQDLVVKS